MNDHALDLIRNPDRLDTLRTLELLDTLAEEAFDRLAQLAARLLHTPIALVSLVDADRQFFKSCLGLPEPWSSWRETPLSHSFCQHVVASNAPLVISDARIHPLFCTNLAIRDLNIIAYLGIPLTLPNGRTLGSFCVADNIPRAWTEEDIHTVRDFAASVMSEIELRTLRGKLEARVMERSAELQRALESLETTRTAAASAQEQLGEIVTRITDGFVALDKNWRYTYVNQRAAAMFGRTPQDLIGKHIWSEFPEGVGQPFYHAYHRAMAEQVAIAIEDYYAPWERWFENRIYPSPEGISIYFHEITERKRTEQALARSEEKFRALAETTSAAIFIQQGGQLIYANRRAMELTGYSLAELTTMNYLQLVHADFHARIAAGAAARQRKEAAPANYEIKILCKSGAERWVDIAMATIEIDGQAAGLGTAYDITERKRVEALLNGEKQVLEMMAEGAPLSEILTTITRNIEALSQNMRCSILLLDADGLHLRHGAAPSLPDAFNRAIDGAEIGPQAGSCGTAAYRNQAVIVTDIATDPLWADYRALALQHGLRACWSTPIRSVHGLVLGTFALYYREPCTPVPADLELIERVTHLSGIAIERKQAEDQLRNFAHQLELLSRQLLTAQEAERRHIARELHDEIGQLLTVIKLDLQGVLHQPGVQSFAPALQESIETVDQLVGKVRDLSLNLRPSMLDDLGLVPALRWYVQRQATHLGFAIALQLPVSAPRLPPEMETACFRIIQEALTNAARHAQATQVKVALSIGPQYAELTVRDNGIGFDVASTQQSAIAGGGFGLLGMQERAQLVGGALQITSTPRVGTLIAARFPLPVVAE
jgi:PAS domain S-box-containing protein